MTDTSLVFEDSDDKPTGRKARIVPDVVWNALADSAKRDVAKVVNASEDAIAALRRDLASAVVRARYDVTIATASLDGGKMRLRFSAVAKPVKPVAVPAPEVPVPAAAPVPAPVKPAK
jgi:hypothetical protein